MGLFLYILHASQLSASGEVVRNLIQAGHEVHVVTGAPDYVYTIETQSPRLFIRKVLLDCGAVQADALTVDPLASLEKISDVVPVACRAAADAGIRAVCCTNFSWDFIYADYVMSAGYHNRSIIWQIAEDYSHCEFVIRLPGYCPMPAFRDVIDVPLVVRRLHKTREKPAGWKLKKEYLPEGWICLVCGASEDQEIPSNFIKLPKDFYTPDAIAASDVLLGKIGYGTTSEALAYKVPLIFVRRDYFNEEPFLRNMIEFSGARRLRDAIVLGYQLQRITGKDIAIPEWYSLAQNELSSRTQLANKEVLDISSLTRQSDYFTILHGDHQGLPDTLGFLKSLAEMESSGRPQNNNKLQTRGHLAASAMFNWEEEIFVSRAPGRLDVMGGIADYSGSLVLQVSLGSELGNRGPTFDMDLSDFVEDGRPITYEKAYNYFARDPAQKWAAYVAGTILVLMTELGIRFEDSISILVENHIVGAPCGVMDQMASACGEANKLLAMVCQPAEVLGLVDIPPTIRFWGIDSGIRHSVGGSDYKSVRVGAFMGKKIIKSSASVELCSSLSNISTQQINKSNHDDADEDGKNLLETEASLDYLCNLSAHRFVYPYSLSFSRFFSFFSLAMCNISYNFRYEASYATRLPESLSGQEFMEKYLDHDDSVTTIDKERNYAVRAPTRHPIYENFRVKCHFSYSACGLASNGTDRLVNLVQEMQHSKSSESEGGTLFGAKITGGGSGGTVCVIGRNCLRSNQQLVEIQQRYKTATGFSPYVFEGSSPGAAKFGHLQIRLLKSRQT
ncbi:hypothetical protein EJD97_018509 [Solanum chilense]|uniref:L-arabinokinase n=1 Tax=Solanum chilense TaxID=4083 RepID=A0A6N2B0U4_SOLCI|nr:hypothetical protein EJD97_018509 [Solanum chilense]